MGSANGKVLLLLDKYPAHPPDTKFLRNTEVIFLPVNYTSRLQLLNLAVIYSMKAQVSRGINSESNCCQREKGSARTECHTSNPYDNAFLEDSKFNTISNCFRKVGFIITDMHIKQTDEVKLEKKTGRNFLQIQTSIPRLCKL
jgi:hypothetical protein